ncbi:adenine-specific DNA-methyltransferase [Tenacibaculum gallaicum]|uniref:site-specific DNA-methyltransferase (adenine-specific) n=1 Tax=Tenacibaculum gallaicum TaxID=561505 RepID=A0A3E0HM20_9FLAO|nr:site-specific DNA-methyltransferase [Tenacibaculum gallaicum]REH47457.1 adenine-specific DNA-methyltransferase [Tenacibaculum gallaicum]
MPTLNWIGKEKVISHHQDVPYRVLEHKYGFTAEKGEQNEPTKSGNKIIHGDNLEALKSLLPEYEGKIKCIYIDPPYNTGNEGWTYNDNVNHPKIKRWLDETLKAKEQDKVAAIGVDDLTRHDKWLCMMYPRLKLLHKLLADDGVIFISIDDHELAHLRLLMDEIFGRNNFIEYFCWTKTSTPPSLANKSRKTVEYIICYEKKKDNLKYNAELSDGGDAPLLNSGNPHAKIFFPREKVYFKLPDGKYKAGQYDKAYLHKDITIENGYADIDFELTAQFKWVQNTIDLEIEKGTEFIIKSDKFSIRFLRTDKSFKAPTNLLKEKYLNTTINKVENNVDTNEGAKKVLNQIFGKDIFNYPKPYSLIEFLLKIGSGRDSIILDSFAGSGTTAHAVLNLNKEDGGKRKFILVEMEEYANDITAERVKRVTKGYGKDKKAVEGTGGAFNFYELGLPLFDENQNLNEEVGLSKIREYIWFSETRTSFTEPNAENYFLGKKEESVYYFIYEKDHLTTLDYDSLELIKTKGEQYIVYADNCLLPKGFMAKNNIIFKKIPRDITRF